MELIHTEIVRARLAAESIDRWTHRMTAEVLGARVDQVCHLHFALGGEYDEDAVMAALESACVRALAEAPSSARTA